MKHRRIFKTIGLLAVALLLTMPAEARKKPTYEITLKINNGRDTIMYLGRYYARGNEVIDTAVRDKKGRFVFTGTTDTLVPGLYFFANPKGNYVEFVVYHEKPFFTFETEQRNWTSNMTVKGSKQNEFFFDFRKHDARIDADLREHELTMDSATFAAYRQQQLRKLDSIKIVSLL